MEPTLDNDDRVGEVLAAYLEAIDAGWAPNREALLRRYPALRPQLEAYFAAESEVRTLSASLRDRTPNVADVSVGPAAVDPSLVVPQSFGDYELLEEIARGGMGIVYRARQKSANRVVALKMILPGRLASEEDLRRFRQEAEAAALMDHPHIVPIYDVGEWRAQDDGSTVPYFTMKLIEGGSLAEHPEHFREPRPAGRLIEEVARAVHYAHQRGILHRDLKPGNILLGENDVPLVVDFGLAKRIEGDAGLTQSGAIVGTPNYMAPEQASGTRAVLTTAADVHALGAILYELLTGQPPFQADNLLDTLLQLRQEKPRPPRQINPKVDADLETICLKSLEKEPAQRYGTAAALADDLERWLKGEVIQARRAGTWNRLWKWMRRRPALAALTGVSLLALLLLFIGVGSLLQLRESEVERDQAKEARADAVHARGLALDAQRRAEEQEELAQHHVYINRVMRAHFEWQNNDVARADLQLDLCSPRLRHWEWRYVKRLCHSELFTLQGHTDSVNSVAISSDGQRIVSGSGDAMVKVWDATTGQEVFTLKGHTYGVSSVAFSPDGKRLVSGSGDAMVKVWDATTGQEVFTRKGHTWGVTSVAFSSDGKRLVSGSADKTVKVWDATTGQESLTLKGHTDGVYSVAFSRDGKRLISGSGDKTVKVWDVTTGQETLTLKGHTGFVTSVAISSDDQRIVSASWDHTVKVWDATTGQEGLTLKGHTDRVWSMAFSADGKRIVSGSIDKALKVWDAHTGQEVLTLKGHTGFVTSVAVSSDGKRLVSGSADQTVKVWNGTTGQQPLTLKGHTGFVTSVAISRDGQRIVAGSQDPMVKVWNATTGQVALTLKGHTSAVYSVAISSDGKRIVSGSADQTVKIWDASTGQEALTLKGHAGVVNSVAFSSDGQRIVSDSGDSTVKVWDAATGQEVLTLKGHTDPVTSVALSSDGQRIVSGSWDQTVKVWDASTGQEALTLKGHAGVVDSVAFSSDGQRIVSGSRHPKGIIPGEIKVWDATTGQQVLTLNGHTDGVLSVAFSSDGKRLVSGSADQTVKVWDATTGQETLTLKGHTGAVSSVAFSGDGQRIVSGSGDKTVKVWDATPLPEVKKP